MKRYRVTQVLSPWQRFDGIPAETLRLAAERGTRIHAAAAAKLTGSFLVTQLHAEDLGYWQSLEVWIDRYVEDVIAVEPELADECLGYTGDPDLLARVMGRFTVCDWKTPQISSLAWRPQLAAYCALAQRQYRGKWRGMTVQPRPDGKEAKGTPYTYQQQNEDFVIFFSALNVYRFFNQNAGRGGKNGD